MFQMGSEERMCGTHAKDLSSYEAVYYSWKRERAMTIFTGSWLLHMPGQLGDANYFSRGPKDGIHGRICHTLGSQPWKYLR